MAKSRLATALSPAERRMLFAAMLADVLRAARACAALEAVAVVTADPFAARIAADSGAIVIPDTLSAGHSAAVAQGAAHLERAGVPTLLTLPGDVPCVTPEELTVVASGHRPGRAVTIVPSRDGRGTNCLAVTPPSAIRFRFGDVSLPEHLGEAAAAGIEPLVLQLAGVALDIDTPEDLGRLLDATTGSHTREFLKAHDTLSRPRLGQTAASTRPATEEA